MKVVKRIFVQINKQLRTPTWQDTFKASAVADFASPENVNKRRDSPVFWRSRGYQSTFPNTVST